MYEYKVVPAPVKGVKAKGVKTPEARFALGVEAAINALAAEGWEYQRSDVLASEERQGLTGTATHWRTLLVFRREVGAEVAGDQPTDTGAMRTEPVLTATPVVAALAAPVSTASADADSDAEDARFEEGSEETRPA